MLITQKYGIVPYGMVPSESLQQWLVYNPIEVGMAVT